MIIVLISDISNTLQSVFKSLNPRLLFLRLRTANVFDLLIRIYIVLVLIKYTNNMLPHEYAVSGNTVNNSMNNYSASNRSDSELWCLWYLQCWVLPIIAVGLVSILSGVLASWIAYGDIDDLCLAARCMLGCVVTTLAAFTGDESDEFPINF